MNIYRRNVNSLCRSCLTEVDQLADKCNMNEDIVLRDLFAFATSLPAASSQDLPQYLCCTCCTKLREFDEFREMMLRSHRILGDMLNLALEIECNNNTKREETAAYDASHYENYEWLELQVAEHNALDYNGEDVADDHTTTGHCSEDEEILEVVAEVIKEADPTEDIIVQEFEETLDAMTIEKTSIYLSEHYDDMALPDNLSAIVEGSENSNVNCDDCVSLSEIDVDTKDSDATQTRKVKAKSINDVGNKLKSAPKRGEVKFFCAQCPQRWFLTQTNLDAHKRTHEGLKPFPCSECQRSFNLSTQLRVHIREDHSANPKRIDCPYDGCEKWFTKSGSLKTHMRNKHARYTPYICEDCGRIFNNSFSFREHRYKHKSEEEYPFKCEECDKRFAAKSRYMRHLVRHSGVKSFECPHCDMKKYTRDELNAHMNMHTKEKLWTCKYCPKVFTTSTNWRIHEQTVHKGIRKFNCRYCELSFGRPHTRKRHEMTHTGDRPFVCECCDKRFIQAATLASHMKTHSTQHTNHINM